MKRSEATNVIKDELLAHGYKDNEFIDLEELSHRILQELEVLGMLPPGSHYTLTNISNKKVGESFVCQWEPENE